MTNNNGTFCTTTIVRKKRGGNDVTSCDVTSGYDVISGHVTDLTSVHVTSGDVIFVDVTSSSTPLPNYDTLQVLKTVKYRSKH
jgi:hypothetical protein